MRLSEHHKSSLKFNGRLPIVMLVFFVSSIHFSGALGRSIGRSLEDKRCVTLSR
ncbi:MAG: hypothetical protein RMY31_015275 [Dendronalium sp. ChiSLP03b]